MMTYKTDSEIKLEYPGATTFDENGTQAFIWSNKQNIIIAFRGTESFIDWLTDMAAIHVKAHWAGTVHYGFKHYVDQIGDALYYEMDQRDCGQTILVTGHSLGGAASTLWIDKWLRHTPVDHITFGSPRPGDSAFGNSFARAFPQSLRVTNNSDIVPHVPTAFPAWVDMLLGLPGTPGQFRHAQPQHLHLDVCGTPIENPSKLQEWRDFFAGLYADFGIKGLAGIKHHSQYLDKIRGLP